MEVWKDVKGFESYYEVSNLGNVRRKKGTSHLKPKKLKHMFDKDGYRRVNLKIKQKSHTKIIHRLLAEAFIPNPKNKPQVNHKDGNKKNNDLSNLEWVTLSENRQHAYDTGLQNSESRRGEKNNFSKLTKKDVLKIRQLYSSDLRGVKKENYKGRMTMKMIGKKYNISQTNVSSIVNKKIWKHV